MKIPVEYHIKLHTLKVLKGQSISDTVEKALTRYFDGLTGNPDGRRLEALSEISIRSLL